MNVIRVIREEYAADFLLFIAYLSQVIFLEWTLTCLDSIKRHNLLSLPTIKSRLVVDLASKHQRNADHLLQQRIYHPKNKSSTAIGSDSFKLSANHIETTRVTMLLVSVTSSMDAHKSQPQNKRHSSTTLLQKSKQNQNTTQAVTNKMTREAFQILAIYRTV